MTKKVLVHFFNASFRYYERSDFIDIQPYCGIPGLSTELQPPLLICAEGYIPVFTIEQKWVIKKNEGFFIPSFEDRNYNTGCPGVYSPFVLNTMSRDFPRYENLPQIMQGISLPNAIQQKVKHIHSKYYELKVKYEEVHDSAGSDHIVPFEIPDSRRHQELNATPTLAHQYHFLSEELVASMKCVIDYLVQLTSINTNYDECLDKNKPAKSGLGNLWEVKDPKTDLERVICGDQYSYIKDNTNFLQVINELANSIKHSVLHPHSYSEFPIGEPSIISYQAKHNEFSNKIIRHCHSLEQIMIGFRNTVLRILENQKIHQASQQKDITNH